MAYVMFAMLFVLLIIGVVITATIGNSRQAGEQETGMRAYYVARSGVEAAYESLLTTEPSLLTGPAVNSFLNNGAMVLNDTLSFDQGTAEVTVSCTGTGFDRRIRIRSVGTIDGVSRTVALEFYLHYDKHPEMYWSK